jgi:hypothetical protein
MFGDSVQIPASRLEPIATEAASNAKSVAGVVFFLAVAIGCAAVGVMVDGSGGKEDGTAAAGGMAFWALLIGAIAMRFVRTARAAGAAALRAKTDPTSHWYLSGKMVVASDANGTPRPDLSFKVSNKLRQMLLAVPKATVVE